MSSKEPRDFETPHVLLDSPLEQDEAAYFHFDQFASTLARLIADRRTRTPLVIGVSGSWGTGKTTLLRRVRRQLDQTLSLQDRKEPYKIEFVNVDEAVEQRYRVCRTVWFNAWKYATEDELLVALVRVIVQTMAQDGAVQKMIGKMLDPAYPRRDVINTVLSWFAIQLPGLEITLNTGEPQPTPFTEKTALLDLFDEAFDRLMAVWVHRTLNARKINPQKGVLVVFIDDLDRCLPDKTVQVLEAIKLFLDRPGCVFVLGADVDFIKQAVAKHYKDISGQKADDYLEKVIQLRFQLPPIVADSMQEYLQAQSVSQELLSQWQTLIAAAEINPRRVKAVVNDLSLQWAMLQNIGQAEGVDRTDFFRWQALMRAAPDGFRERIFAIDDLGLRLKFIQDALHWVAAREDETLARVFAEYETPRLRGVLRAIGQFSDSFDAGTLDAFVHLAAPPRRPLEMKGNGGEPAIAPGGLAVKTAGQRGERPLAGVQTWGGLEFVRVPPGKFLMGSKEDNLLAFDDEKPQHAIDLPNEYWIARYPVTNAQFAAFVQAAQYQTTAEKEGTGYAYDGKEWKDTPGADWQHPRGSASNLEGKQDHPAVQVSWLDAQAYFRWLNQAHGGDLPEGWVFRLPSEAEWEKAARGEYGNEWPWGDEAPDKTRCNFDMNVADTTSVGQYSPRGDSPYGAADMAGNAWEWMHTSFADYHYQPEDGREKEDESSLRVLRGGSFYINQGFIRCAYRSRLNPTYRGVVYGFRVVASPIQL